MKTITMKGNSVEEVINEFMKEKGLSKRDFSYEIKQEAAKGFLGIFGNKQAVVKFKLQDPDEMVESFLVELFEKMQIEKPNIEMSIEDKAFYVRIYPRSDVGLLVGKDGRFIDQLQYLLNRVFEEHKTVGKILLDVDNYRERQKEQFRQRIAKQIANFQSMEKKYITIFSLDAGSRRIVHREVEKISGLSTLTIGDGKLKNVVVFNKDQASEEDFKHMTYRDKRRPRRKPTNGRRPNDRNDRHDRGERKERSDRGERPERNDRNRDRNRPSSDNRRRKSSNYRPRRNNNSNHSNHNSNRRQEKSE